MWIEAEAPACSDIVLAIFDRTTIVAELGPMAKEIEVAIDKAYAAAMPME